MQELVIQKINTSLTAFEIYTLFEKPNHIFLDSAKNTDSLGGYSFIGINPFLIIKYEDGKLYKNGNQIEGFVFDVLNDIINQYRIVNPTELPFISGGIGYFSYDLAWTLEKLPHYNLPIFDLPDCYFVFYDNIIIYNHINIEVFITAMGIIEDGEKSITTIKTRIKEGSKIRPYEFHDNPCYFQSPFTKETYETAVERMRQYIKKGDIYIANMTHTFTTEVATDSFETYGILRQMNPAPFAAYMPLEGFEILSSSPERFLQIKNKVVETRPIKGTRPRGATPDEDDAFRLELLNSEKDKSELLMIVDLERNDLSKVCKPHSVKVTELFKIEAYTTVYHLVSTIIGELQEQCTSVDCIKACFPGGSITGTPKIRAMEVIEELEANKRGIYTGCIGYLGFDGNTDMNIVIRTIVKKDDKAYVGVGGGITWESDPEAEYVETLDKAKALFRTLNLSIKKG